MLPDNHTVDVLRQIAWGSHGGNVRGIARAEPERLHGEAPGTGVVKHWLADKGDETLVVNYEHELEGWRRDGYAVRGPYVPSEHFESNGR